jgi:GT2 family glycosyltransferase
MKPNKQYNIEAVKTAIVILNWNGWQDTIECLQSLCQLDSDHFAVIVVDNASTNDSRERITAWMQESEKFDFNGIVEQAQIEVTQLNLSHQTCVYIQSAINGGFSYGNNLGIRLALQQGYDYVWLLNNDTVVDTNALNALLARIRAQQNIGMCGSVLRFYDDKEIVQAVGGVNFNFLKASGTQLGQGLHYSDSEIIKLAKAEPTYIAGASLLVSSQFLKDVGLMEESYFLYFEEIDWAVRAKPRWQTAIALDSVVYHKEGASIGTDSRAERSALSQYYLHRNLIRFYALRKTWLLPIALFSSIKEILKLIIRQDWALAKVTVSALLDGLLMRHGQLL